MSSQILDLVALNKDECEKLTENERKQICEFTKKLGINTALSVLTYPITFAKTLFYLGYEPYPLTFGKIYIVTGRNAYFLPNGFVYLRNIARDYGTKVLFTGIDAAIVSGAVNSFATFAAKMYLDHYFPNIGGVPENLDKEESELTHHESARVTIREAIRKTIAQTIGVIAARPFTVIMVREIAQLVCHETKYSGLITSMLRIGEDEGLPGFYSGLIPTLLIDYFVIWGVSSIRFVANRMIEQMYENTKNEESQKRKKNTQTALVYFTPLLVNSLTHSLNIVSTIMAIGGSGLAISILPYSPIFSHWSDAYNYLKPYGLARGARLFLREQKGAIAVGQDHRIYASNSHFI